MARTPAVLPGTTQAPLCIPSLARPRSMVHGRGTNGKRDSLAGRVPSSGDTYLHYYEEHALIFETGNKCMPFTPPHLHAAQFPLTEVPHLPAAT